MNYKMEELLPVVSQLALKYGGGESTSMTYEKAQTLMEAVLYCLHEYDSSCENGLIDKNISVKEQYKIGAEIVLKKAEEIKKIFNRLSFQLEDFGVKCLHDTVQKGIPEFLKWYDIRFCPQDTILTLDYPLLSDISSLTGADAVYEYIKAVQIEQQFLSLFDKGYVVSVLQRYSVKYQDMIENICGIVLTNAMGRIAVRKPFDDTKLLHKEYAWLSQIFSGKSVADLEHIVKGFIKEITIRFYENNSEMLAYLQCEAGNAAVRIYTANQYGQLSKVFV